MIDSYLTIKSDVSAEIVEKKSKFIANIFYIENDKEAIKKLEEIRKLHKDARHNVFSYRIANGEERASDDGEPSGTAGIPILDILRGNNLQNIIVIVTRYFGGILLGTGGLVKAYTDVTKDALKKAFIINKKLKIELILNISYEYNNIVNHFLRSNQISIISCDYSDKVKTIIAVDCENEEIIINQLNELTNRNIEIIRENKCFYAVV